MNVISISLTSLSPLLMHNSRFANPLDPMTQAHKELTSKRKKTEEDHLAIMKSEWMGALYCNDQVGPYIPGVNVEACIFEAAKMQKLGKTAKRALLVLEDEIPLKYSGPRDPESLYDNKKFVDVRAVKVQTAKLFRCRPKFDNWSCKFRLQYNPEQMQLNEILKTLQDAGSLIGLGDYRPRFGKFSVEVGDER